uniref:Uncharacterized protein n=1 Tax=Cucumis melo TaxID=3656 RepID=A0A9I9EM85_CUCME
MKEQALHLPVFDLKTGSYTSLNNLPPPPFLFACKLSKHYIIWQYKFLNALKDNDGHARFVWMLSTKHGVLSLVLPESIGAAKPYLRQFIDV